MNVVTIPLNKNYVKFNENKISFKSDDRLCLKITHNPFTSSYLHGVNEEQISTTYCCSTSCIHGRGSGGEECICNGKSFCTSFVLSSVRFGLSD